MYSFLAGSRQGSEETLDLPDVPHLLFPLMHIFLRQTYTHSCARAHTPKHTRCTYTPVSFLELNDKTPFCMMFSV